MTDIEEKKIDEVEEEESDFADEIKTAEPAPAPVEEKEPEETIDLHSEEPEEEEEAPAPTPAPGKKGKITIEYPDENLGQVELARQEFYKVYHKSNIVKWIVSGVCILLIVCGWLIPNAIEALKENSMLIALIACGVGLVGLLVFNFFWRRNVQGAMNRYFREYYEHVNAYCFPKDIENLQGSIDNKIDEEELKNCDLYKDVGKVGSRATYTFDYHEKTIKVCDAAAQVVLGKTLRTVFVGKYLYTTNNYKGSDILIYFKGNKRALPPTNLAERKVFSDSKNIVIYGDKGTEKVITPKVREALNEFKTNKTFVDMAISIREGMTYFAMGYEDDLMVIALEKPFDPKPTVQYAGDLKKVLKLIDLLK